MDQASIAQTVYELITQMLWKSFLVLLEKQSFIHSGDNFAHVPTERMS